MTAKIISPLLYHYTENQSADVTGGTVGACLSQLTERHPGLQTLFFRENGTLYEYLDVYVNKKGTDPETVLSTPVSEGDEIHVIVLIEGG